MLQVEVCYDDKQKRTLNTYGTVNRAQRANIGIYPKTSVDCEC